MILTVMQQECFYVVVHTSGDGQVWLNQFLSSPLIDLPEGQIFPSGELIKRPDGSFCFGMIAVGEIMINGMK